jgi:hypothetical protein
MSWFEIDIKFVNKWRGWDPLQDPAHADFPEIFNRTVRTYTTKKNSPIPNKPPLIEP